ncbi:hypothetical protein [Microbacterium trichothecenolyticum]|uniref:Uncharacterized protein n=1 Tax=Microbacterium trichothecenolyticum TaxID=69370 RepID=A0ABU0TUA0_MICTR|nr:hypothetical protein [Microbacterium trichothecenolyticum]MDQ1123241.1 hypothetical protein [Microbacterium trichothecenolyticum]
MVMLVLVVTVLAVWATASLAAGIGLGRVMARTDAERVNVDRSSASSRHLTPAGP